MNESLSCGKKLQVFGSSICGFEGMYQNLISFKCASGSGVEHHLAKVGAAGSNPVSRSYFLSRLCRDFFVY